MHPLRLVEVNLRALLVNFLNHFNALVLLTYLLYYPHNLKFASFIEIYLEISLPFLVYYMKRRFDLFPMLGRWKSLISFEIKMPINPSEQQSY